MSLASNALIDIDEYKTLAGVDHQNTGVDEDQIEAFINSSSQAIESYCSRKFITPSADVAEINNGSGNKSLFVKEARISALTSIEVWTGLSWTTVSATTYPYISDADSGRIWFTNGHAFNEGEDNYRINYKYGWAIESIPHDLKQATATITRVSLRRSEKAGLSSESFGDATTSYSLAEIPKDMQMTLDKYRRTNFG